MPRNRIILKLLAPTLLLVVAIGQMVAVNNWQLNPWKGGGFGMFAEIEKRTIKHWAYTSDDVFHTALIPELEREYVNASTLPSKKNLLTVAHRFNEIIKQEDAKYQSVALVIGNLAYDSQACEIHVEPFEIEEGTTFLILSRDGEEIQDSLNE
ncbi:hypothetical protein [Bremerella alba]|uniref:Uncharacterized protein n=1 Tax=Bremerella alba TaxID=980252 RepID=A0A7V8V9K7_9BACT|nr:hypothetical protein [Bremerella alba]MBA2117249.1 hypothetical protein [Bremerella alba]